MKNVATRFTVGKAGRARVMSVLRATLVVTATFQASAANLVAFLKSLTDIANGVEIPALGTNGGLALQPFAAKLPR